MCGAKLAILKIKIIVDLEQAMILDTKSMGLALILMEVGITKTQWMMKPMPSAMVQQKRWHILLRISQVDFDQIHLNLNQSRLRRKLIIWEINMGTKAWLRHPLRTTISSITKAWANRSKVVDSAFTSKRPCRQIHSQHPRMQDQQNLRTEALIRIESHAQVVVESLPQQPLQSTRRSAKRFSSKREKHLM